MRLAAPGDSVLDRSALTIEFSDDFDGDRLDPNKWIDHYLPHWSLPELSAARHRVVNGSLVLSIDADQPPWNPDADGGLRVSNLQTGSFSGPAASSAGQHRFRDGLLVKSPQLTRRLYTPRYGVVEARIRATDDPRCMVALWMIGFEETATESSEICVFEIFGRDIGASSTRVGMGVHPFADPRITDDFVQVAVPIDAREFHLYSVEWMPDETRFYIDDKLVASLDQSPDYPLQLMLDIFEFPVVGHDDRTSGYPKEFVVDYVRGYRREG